MSSERIYWVDFGSGKNRVLNFSGYEVVQTKGLPSEPKFTLSVKFQMEDNVQIKSDGQIKAKSHSLIVIDASCRLVFHTTSGRYIATINLYRQYDRRMYVKGPYFFDTFIHPSDAENLMHIINGEAIIIEWIVNGYASAITHPHRRLPIMRFEVSNSSDDPSRWPQISSSDYNSKILQRLGMNEKFVTEFPLQMPATLTAYPNFPNAIKGMQSHIKTLVTNLKTAIDILRNPRSINDYRQVMDQLKTSVETIRTYVRNNKTDLSKEIFIDTGVIADVDPGGGMNAAGDIIEKFGGILENIYQISSKPAHGVPRKGQPQIRFNFSPERSDAEFVLSVTLASARYLLDKIEAYINYNK